jgi:hypothetical protein
LNADRLRLSGDRSKINPIKTKKAERSDLPLRSAFQPLSLLVFEPLAL